VVRVLLRQSHWYSVVLLLLLPLKREGVSYSVRRGRPVRSTILTRPYFGAPLVVASKTVKVFYSCFSSDEVCLISGSFGPAWWWRLEEKNRGA
jgi:hypothetical protein